MCLNKKFALSMISRTAEISVFGSSAENDDSSRAFISAVTDRLFSLAADSTLLRRSKGMRRLNWRGSSFDMMDR